MCAKMQSFLGTSRRRGAKNHLLAPKIFEKVYVDSSLEYFVGRREFLGDETKTAKDFRNSLGDDPFNNSCT